MIVIASAAFVTPELQVELGKLPPALLPLGNRRLYEHQVTLLRRTFPETRIYLSLADTHVLRDEDAILMRALSVEIVRVADGLTLGESILYVINSIGLYDEPLRILHGDTLLSDLPPEEDLVAVAEAEDNYAWEVQSATAKHADVVWCGYFCFSDIKLFSKCLSTQRYKFVDAVRAYGDTRPLSYRGVRDWLDLGHVNTYFRSRSEITTQRSFNALKVFDGIVRKSGVDRGKLEAEANWYQHLPPRLKRFTPQFLGCGEGEEGFFYETEYLPLLPLNELYVHGSLPDSFWRRVVRVADQVLRELQAATPPDDIHSQVRNDFLKLVREKTEQRMVLFSRTSGVSLDRQTRLNGASLPSLSAIARECQEAAADLPCLPGILHGDFCFSNILYDSRSTSLKLLDPRGLDAAGEPKLVGNLAYDVAKFYHSLYGYYDYIVAGCYSLEQEGANEFQFRVHAGERLSQFNGVLADSGGRLLGLGFQEALPLVVILFLSMLPLHADDAMRQKALLANALRLYSDWTRR